MISTAIAIQDATGNAVVDFSTMKLAREIYQNKDTMSSEDFAEAMFAYSAHLSALTATLVVNAVMSEADLTSLLSTVREMDEMGKDNE